MSKDVYDYLAKESVSELSITNLDSSTSSTAVDRTNIAFWGGPITLARVMEATRTYPHGLPIPERSAVGFMVIEEAGSDMLRPDDPGLFQILSVISSQNVSLFLYDGTTPSLITSLSAGVPFVPSYPLIITPTLYLTVVNNSGVTAQLTIPYHTVGL